MRRFISLVVIFVMLFGVAPSFAQGAFFEHTLIGQKAPDATFEMSRGGEVSLSQTIKDHKSILFFWATWCPHCREQLKVIQEKKEELEKNGIVVALIDIGEDKETVERFLKSKNYALNILLDKNQYAAEMYNVVGIPTFCFIGADGLIRDIQNYLPDEYLQILN